VKNIYFDFDGCINIFSGKPPRQNTFWMKEWKTTKLEGQPIMYSAELVEAINELASRDDVRPVWLTDWQELARDVVAPEIGLDGPWDVLTGDLGAYPWWKLKALQDDLKENPVDKFVVIDDNLLYSKEMKEFVLKKDNVLPIHPNAYHGVTKRNISGIIEFIDENK
jgi:hypothetical protein